MYVCTSNWPRFPPFVCRSLLSLKKASIGFENMFEEVPIVIKNSHLINVLMWELEDKSTVTDKHELLNLSSRSDQNSLSTPFSNTHLGCKDVKSWMLASAIWINYVRSVYLWEPTFKRCLHCPVEVSKNTRQNNSNKGNNPLNPCCKPPYLPQTASSMLVDLLLCVLRCNLALI